MVYYKKPSGIEFDASSPFVAGFVAEADLLLKGTPQDLSMRTSTRCRASARPSSRKSRSRSSATMSRRPAGGCAMLKVALDVTPVGSGSATAHREV
jgi:hypothetical protein